MSSSGVSGGGGAGAALQLIPSGYYVAGEYTANATTTQKTNTDMQATPLFVPRALTLTRIGIEITTAGSAGSVLRLGLYNAAADGYPSSLLLDAGTLDGTLGAGFYEITISQALAAGTFWTVYVQQGAPVTPTTVRGANNTGFPNFSTTGGGVTNPSGRAGLVAVGGAAGALPGAFPAGVDMAGNTPRIAVKAA